MNKPLGRVGAAVAALLVGIFALFALSPAAQAAAPPDPATVLASWKSGDPLFVQSGSPLSSSQQNDIRKALEESKSKIYVAALPDGTVSTAQVSSFIPGLLAALDQAGRSSATVAVLDGNSLFAGSSALPKNAAGQLAKLSTSSNSDVVTGMQDFVNRVNLVVERKVKDARDPASTVGGGGGSGVLVGILGIAVVGGGGLWVISRRMKRKREEKEAAELAAVKQTVEEDVTKFGEEITELDVDVKMLPQSETTSTDWQRALDSYERAKVELGAVKRSDELRTVTSTLEDGRYALACVKARVNNQPVPERLPPCFFNPQHGPSVRNVRWAPPAGAVRDVPACAADAEAVERGFDPQMREVMVNGQRRPYWDAGPAYQPYAYGYYGGFGGDLMTGMLVGTMLGGAFGGGWGGHGYGSGYESGYQDGVDAGGGDWGGGGSDFGGGGGGDWGGGGDFGGGDFGGGDW